MLGGLEDCRYKERRKRYKGKIFRKKADVAILLFVIINYSPG
jgi:hypothetical protein